MEQAKYARRRRDELEQEKATLAKERTELLEWKKQREAEDADATRAPTRFLKKKFGEKWKDTLAQVATTDEVTPGMVVSELEERTNSLRAEFEGREKKLREEWQSDKQKQSEAENERARNDYSANALTHIKQSPDKYPGVLASGLAGNVGQVIQNEYMKTCGVDDEGNVTPGKLLTPEEAGQKMEAELKDFYQKLKKAFEPSPGSDAKPSSTGSTSDESRPNTQRRTLSNTLPSRAPQGWTPPKDDTERRQRAYAAWDAAAAQNQKH